jgi:chromosome partitioning related protein ParA
MAHKIAAISTKGGVGKTTTLANLGGVLADMNLRVLMVDADIQPSLSKYYDLEFEAPDGLTEIVTTGSVGPSAISRTILPNLHLIKSNDGQAELQHWLHNQPDRRSRLALALSSPVVTNNYDFVLIDTQGAIGPLQTCSAFAADTLLSPLPPDTASIREFRTGMLQVLHRLEQSESEPTTALAPIRAVICKFDYSRDAKAILRELQSEFTANDKVDFIQTVIPDAVAYKEAFSLRVPVHKHNIQGGRRMPSAYEVMHRIVWDLVPDLYGQFAGGLSGDPKQVFGDAPDVHMGV